MQRYGQSINGRFTAVCLCLDVDFDKKIHYSLFMIMYLTDILEHNNINLDPGRFLAYNDHIRQQIMIGTFAVL